MEGSKQPLNLGSVQTSASLGSTNMLLLSAVPCDTFNESLKNLFILKLVIIHSLIQDRYYSFKAIYSSFLHNEFFQVF